MLRRFDSGALRFGIPGIVLGIFLAWVCGSHQDRAEAQAQGSPTVSRQAGAIQGRAGDPGRPQPARGVVAGESGGIMALVSDAAQSPYQWLYLIDTRKKAFALYKVDSIKGNVKLEASRQFRWDLELDQYNNVGLEPADVKARVDALSQTNP